MALTGVIDDHMLLTYRSLLDLEDAAFDELEHAYEEGLRARFDEDMHAWRTTVERRMAFLERHGVALSPVTS